MKLEVKELKKAIDLLSKKGILEVDLTIDDLGSSKVKISSYTDAHGDIVITIFSAESQKIAEITKTERL